MGSVLKSYHRSEPREKGRICLSRLSAPCRRRRRGESAVSSLSSSAWEYCDIHVAVGRVVNREESKKQNSRETRVDFYQ